MLVSHCVSNDSTRFGPNRFLRCRAFHCRANVPAGKQKETCPRTTICVGNMPRTQPTRFVVTITVKRDIVIARIYPYRGRLFVVTNTHYIRETGFFIGIFKVFQKLNRSLHDTDNTRTKSILFFSPVSTFT